MIALANCCALLRSRAADLFKSKKLLSNVVEVIKNYAKFQSSNSSDVNTLEAAVMALSNAAITSDDNRIVIGRASLKRKHVIFLFVDAIPTIFSICNSELGKKGTEKYSNILHLCVKCLFDLSLIDENKPKIVEAGSYELFPKLLNSFVPVNIQLNAIGMISELTQLSLQGTYHKKLC
jgi:hypothetical protein